MLARVHGSSHLPVRKAADVTQLVLAVAGTIGRTPLNAAVLTRRDRVEAWVPVVRVDKGRSGAREEGGEGFAVLLADVEEIGAADRCCFRGHHGSFRFFDGVGV